MQFKLLGPLEVLNKDGPLHLGGLKQRTVLADLLLHREDGVGLDRLVFDVWADDAPPSATRTLKAYVSRLRGTLGEETIARTPTGYRLEADPDRVDAARFEHLIARAESLAPTDPDGAADYYRSALDLWRGDVLGELGAEGFARPEAIRLQELRDLAHEAWCDLELEAGRHLQLIPVLSAAVIARPGRERTWFQLMVALYRSGRQMDALRSYQRAARALGEELGIEPGPELRDLEEQILLHDPDLRYRVREFERHRSPANPTNLREVPTSFVGRRAELDEVATLLAESGLLTITGPGGVGKTRVAVEAGWRMLESYPGGVWDVDLARQIAGADALGPLATTLGVSDRRGGDRLDHIVAHLGDTTTLILLDNCEHILTSVTEAVRKLVDGCPNLSVLATSRAPLNLPEERVLVLEPLGLPEAAPDGDEALADAESVRLFLHRGASAHPGFRLTATNADPTRHVVRLLDGIPLALELAAARLALLTPGEIAGELEHGFPAFSAKSRGDDGDRRHETLRATIDWSYDLLPADQRRLLNRIGVFAAGFTVGEATAVCSSLELAADDIPRLLTSLATHSMVAGPFQASPDRQDRYRPLELVRRYGIDRLAAAEELNRWRLRHVKAMESIAAEAARNLHGPKQKAWYDRLRSSQAELSRALDYAAGLGNHALGRNLCAHLWLWWYLDGRLNDGVDWIDRFTDGVLDPAEPLTAYLLAAKAELLSERGGATEHTGISDEETLLACVGQAVAAARQMEDRRLAAEIWLLCGDALAGIGHYDEAEPLLTDAAEAFADLTLPWAEGWAVLRLVRVHALGRADFSTADVLMERAEPLLETAGEVRLRAYGRLMYANRARLLSDYAESLEDIQEALRAFRELGFDGHIDEALLYLASNLVELGRSDDALYVVGELRERARATNEPSWLTAADLFAAKAHQHRGNDAQSVAILDRLLDRCRTDEDAFHAAVAATASVWALLGVGEIERASAAACASLEAWRSIAHPWHQAEARLVGGEAALAAGEIDAAAEHFSAAASAYAPLSHRQGLASALEGLGAVGRHRNHPAVAARFLGAAGQLRDECGAPPLPRILTRNKKVAHWASSALSEAQYLSSWEDGIDAAANLADLPTVLAIQATPVPP